MPKVLALPLQSMTMLEELEWHFDPEGFMRDITSSALEALGRRIARRYVCAAAADECIGIAIRPRSKEVYGAAQTSRTATTPDPLSDPTLLPLREQKVSTKI